MHFLILGRQIRVDCSDSGVRRVVAANFGAMAVERSGGPADLHYSIEPCRPPSNGLSPAWQVARDGQAPSLVEGLGDLLYLLEKDITVELQRQRSDLLFLHAAALDWHGKACLLAGDSGHGKSTTAWALLHHGFGYLSDELSPIDVARLEVLAYPHALCLKRPPPAAYALPAGVVRADDTLHVPVDAMPGPTVREARPLAAVFVLRYDPQLREPKLAALSAAEGGARLYAVALNALAHANAGLDAAIRIAQQLPCFALASADLPQTCALIRATVEDPVR